MRTFEACIKLWDTRTYHHRTYFSTRFIASTLIVCMRQNKYNEDFFARCIFQFQFQFKEIYDFSWFSLVTSPLEVDLIFRNWCINFHFMTVFSLTSSIYIHKFVIYYANGHLNYLREKRFSGLIMMTIFDGNYGDMQSQSDSPRMLLANKLFCIEISLANVSIRVRLNETTDQLSSSLHPRVFATNSIKRGNCWNCLIEMREKKKKNSNLTV